MPSWVRIVWGCLPVGAWILPHWLGFWWSGQMLPSGFVVGFHYCSDLFPLGNLQGCSFWEALHIPSFLMAAWVIGSIHTLLVGSYVPVKIIAPWFFTTHLLSVNITLQPALHMTRIPMRDAINNPGTVFHVRVVGSSGMVISHTCIECTTSPLGRFMDKGFIARQTFSIGVLAITKTKVAPVLTMVCIGGNDTLFYLQGGQTLLSVFMICLTLRQLRHRSYFLWGLERTLRYHNLFELNLRVAVPHTVRTHWEGSTCDWPWYKHCSQPWCTAGQCCNRPLPDGWRAFSHSDMSLRCANLPQQNHRRNNNSYC